jgi:hypothetical protein
MEFLQLVTAAEDKALSFGQLMRVVKLLASVTDILWVQQIFQV